MISFDLTVLWVIPVGMAVAFMVWVAWHLEKETGKAKFLRSKTAILLQSNSEAPDEHNSDRAFVRPRRQNGRSSPPLRSGNRQGVHL